MLHGANNPLPGPGEGPDDPVRWLGTTRLLDLEDPKLRVRAQSLTQLCKNEREKALAVYGFVKRIPYAKPLKTRLHKAREVMDAARGDAPDKATLLVALLRLAGIPARLRYVELRGEILRGLATSFTSAARALVEAHLGGRWLRTDTYIFDATYMAAARERLRAEGWEWGYAMHVAGQPLWDAAGDAYVGGFPTEEDPMVLQVLGVFDDPQQLVDSAVWRETHPRLARALHWNVLAPSMDRTIRELRDSARLPMAAGARKPS